MLREFIFGSNQTGLVTNASGPTSVVGGENATLANTVMPGQLGIFVGSGTTQSTYTYPSATIAAWNSFFANVTSTSFTPVGTGGDNQTGAANRPLLSLWGALAIVACVGLAML